MTVATKTIPKGYKQTEIGVIPADWDVETLGDISTKVGSGITPTGGERVYKLEGRTFLRSQNIGWGKLILDDVVYINDEIHNTFNSTEVKLNDVFLNITGASIGRSALANERVVNGNVNQHVCIIRPIESVLTPQYLNYFLLSSIGQRYIDSFQAGGNRQGLNFEQIKSIKIIKPSIPEQVSIATTLSDIDALIEKTESLIEKKKAIKQGTMQELLTGKRRLPGFSGEWKKKVMADIGKPYGGISGKTEGDFGEGSSSYIPFMNIMTNPVIDKTFLGIVNILADENQNKVKKGDLLFNTSSETPEELGMCSVLLSEIKDLYLNSFCFGFRLHKELNTDGLFFSYYFRSSVGRKLIFSLAQGATRYNLSKFNFLKLVVPYPEPKEQTAIATILSDMDTEIEKLESELVKWRDMKQGMVQTLLTGKIRLIK